MLRGNNRFKFNSMKSLQIWDNHQETQIKFLVQHTKYILKYHLKRLSKIQSYSMFMLDFPSVGIKVMSHHTKSSRIFLSLPLQKFTKIKIKQCILPSIFLVLNNFSYKLCCYVIGLLFQQNCKQYIWNLFLYF